jgi:hypothetical protein
MEKKKTIVTVLIFLMIIYIFYVCFHDYIAWSPDNSNIYSTNQYSELTDKENGLIDSLEHLNFYNVIITKPLIGLHGPFGSNIYGLSMRLRDSNTNESLDFLVKSLSKTIYTNVIEDSFIYDMNYLYISIESIDSSKIDLSRIKEKEYRIYKDSLEEWCDFKVVRNKGKFNRIETR